MQCLILGGVAVRKLSAMPSKAMYQFGVPVAIFSGYLISKQEKSGLPDAHLIFCPTQAKNIPNSKNYAKLFLILC